MATSTLIKPVFSKFELVDSKDNLSVGAWTQLTTKLEPNSIYYISIGYLLNNAHHEEYGKFVHGSLVYAVDNPIHLLSIENAGDNGYILFGTLSGDYLAIYFGAQTMSKRTTYPVSVRIYRLY